MDGGFLVLVGPVNEDIKIVARLGGDGNELLVAAEIVHQGNVALRGQGRAVLGFLHHHIFIVGGILCRGLLLSWAKAVTEKPPISTSAAQRAERVLKILLFFMGGVLPFVMDSHTGVRAAGQHGA